MPAFPKLRRDTRPGHEPDGGSLFLRRLPPSRTVACAGIVLYVHGGTFPSALSIAHRIDGRSWRDSLCDAIPHDASGGKPAYGLQRRRGLLTARGDA